MPNGMLEKAQLRLSILSPRWGSSILHSAHGLRRGLHSFAASRLRGRALPTNIEHCEELQIPRFARDDKYNAGYAGYAGYAATVPLSSGGEHW